MITYNDIYESARKERYSSQLQSLPKTFIKQVADYLKEKKEAVAQDDDVFGDVVSKTKKQIENARTLFKELLLSRRKKILTLVLIATETGISKKDFDNMLDVEKQLFEDLMKCIECSDKKINSCFNGNVVEDKNNEMVCFLEDVVAFVGFDGKEVGPFEKGQIANLDKQIAKILEEDGKVEVLEE